MRHNKMERLSDRSVTVRWSLFAAFALIVILSSGSIFTLSIIKTSQWADEQAKSLIKSAQSQTDAELHRLFDPMAKEAAIAYAWVTDGLVKRYDTEALMDLFLPSMLKLPQSVSMMISDMTGYEFSIFRNESDQRIEKQLRGVRWTTRDYRRQNSPEEWEKSAKWIEWDENGNKMLRTWWKIQHGL